MPQSEERRILAMIMIMITATLGTAAVVILLLYKDHISDVQRQLQFTVQSQARFLESVARHELRNADKLVEEDSTYEAAQATIRQFIDAHQNQSTFGETGELTLARLENESIVFLMIQRPTGTDLPDLSTDDSRAEAMRRALSGESGTLVGADYRGERVVAAYEPVKIINAGLVAKINLSEVRSDFNKAGTIALLISLILSTISVLFFRKVSNPLIQILSRQTKELQNQIEKDRESAAELEKANLLLVSSIQGQKESFIFGLDTQYRYLFFNSTHHEAMRQLYHANVDIGKSILDCISIVEDAARLKAHCDRALAGELVSVVERYGNDELTFFDVKLSPIVDGHGEIIGLTSNSQNITESTRLVMELRASRERFKTMFEQAPLGIALIDSLDGRFYEVNETFSEITGRSQEEMTTIDWMSITHPDDVQEDADNMALLNAGTISGFNIQKRYIRPDETIVWINMSIASLETNPDESPRHLCMIEDITKRVEFEANRKDMEEKMQQAQKLESLGVLAGGIAHDFNNLLMIILGNADMVLTNLGPHAPAREGVERIANTAHRAAELSKQMLSYSGQGHFIIEPIDLNFLIQEMTHLLNVSVSKSVVLKYHFGSDLPPILGDSTQILQVVMNLIINSSEAIGEKDGVISVTTGMRMCDSNYLNRIENQAGAGLVTPLEEGMYVYLEVADTGCGMTKETQAKIFDPFFTTKFTGRGLGLAALLGIVRGHKGMIRVHSKVEEGTTIEVLLPAADPILSEDSTSEIEKSDADWKGSGLVLLADDEETVRVITKQYLEYLGFDVLTAADGLEAVNLFREHSDKIACVLLDMTMPHMDGKEAFQKIREIKNDAAVILCSGYSEVHSRQHLDGDGLAGFLQKPYLSAELRDLLRQTLG